MNRLRKDPKYSAFTSTKEFQASWEALQEGYRQWLNSERIKATASYDASTKEGLEFLREIDKVIRYIMKNVQPFTEEDYSNVRSVHIDGIFDTIDITIKSKPRFRGTN